jgi:hypothetical protein
MQESSKERRIARAIVYSDKIRRLAPDLSALFE